MDSWTLCISYPQVVIYQGPGGNIGHLSEVGSKAWRAAAALQQLSYTSYNLQYVTSCFCSRH